jgi:putative ABC transport system substrate-binding protein
VSKLRNRLVVLLFLFIGIGSHIEAGQKIVSIQSIGVRPYDDALDGFKHTIADTGIKVQRVVLSALPDVAIDKRLNAMKPNLVLAIGLDALSSVANLKSIPVVYVMVLDPADLPSRIPQATGVRMVVAADKQLAIIRKILPQFKTAGLLYDPQRSEWMVRSIQSAASQDGISVKAYSVNKAEAVPNALIEMAGKIDFFWMLPDLTVVSPQTVEFFLLFSMESGTPLLAFSEKYAERGALLAISADPYDMGRQAGEMALHILNGVDANTIPQEDARKAMVTINLTIAKRIGVKIHKNTIREAKILN